MSIRHSGSRFARWKYWRPYLPYIGFALLAIFAVGPWLLTRPPVGLYVNEVLWPMNVPEAFAIIALIGVIVVRALFDRADEPYSAGLSLLFVLCSGAMTGIHWLMLDHNAVIHEWQQKLYIAILNRDVSVIPHVFRPLPYGFARTVEVLTGNWDLSCIATRWFFNYWFVWAWFQFVRMFLTRGQALVTLIVLLAYYPLSIRQYFGQLTDPLTDFLFLLAMIYTMRDRWILLAITLAFGVLAKETIALIVPVYLACYWRRGWRGFWQSTALGVICLAVFFAIRVPVGWSATAGSMNGTGLMIDRNLHLRHFRLMQPMYEGGPLLVDSINNVTLLTLPFIPFIYSNWRRIDRRLRALLLILPPLVIASNICFGWMYESRNYIPLLPILVTAGMPGLRRLRARSPQVPAPPAPIAQETIPYS